MAVFISINDHRLSSKPHTLSPLKVFHLSENHNTLIHNNGAEGLSSVFATVS